MTGAATKGATRASRYISAGSIDPSSSEMSFFWIVPSKVVIKAAKYAVGVSSVPWSLNVDSRAMRRFAGVFWCGREEDVCGLIFERASSIAASDELERRR